MRLTSPLRVRALSDVREMTRLSAEWEDLWSRCPAATTFQRPEWLLAWMECFCPREPWLLEVRDEGRLIALAPFLFYRQGADRLLALAGGGVSDYLDILVDPVYLQPALSSIWQEVLRQQNEWDAISLTDLSPVSPLLLVPPLAPECTIHLHDSCSVLEIPAEIEDLKVAVPAHKLANLRNARRRMEKAGTCQLQIAQADTLQDALESLFRLHKTRWNKEAQPGVLSDSAVQSFHSRVAPQLLTKGLLRLYTLFLNSESIACLYTLFEKGQVLCYMQGFDPQFAQLSPGTQVLGAVLEDAVRAGKNKVNFLRGREPYKYSWGVKDDPTFRLEARLVFPRGSQTETKAVA